MVAAESDKDVAGMLRPLEFNEQAHQILCSELKHLYTAVTRARVRVVIYDQDQANRAPLFHYLEKRQLCNATSVLGQTSPQGLAVESSAEEWQVQGKNLSERGMFHLAAKCFSKSGDVRAEHEAIAQHLVRHVAPTQLGNPAKLVEVYLEAAERFMAADNAELSVARCCYSAGVQAEKEGDVKRARAFFDLSGKAFAWLARADPANPANDKVLKRAIGCLRKGGSLNTAVELLVSRGYHLQAMKLLRDERQWSQAEAHGLDLFMARIDPDVNSKEASEMHNSDSFGGLTSAAMGPQLRRTGYLHEAMHVAVGDDDAGDSGVQDYLSVIESSAMDSKKTELIPAMLRLETRPSAEPFVPPSHEAKFPKRPTYSNLI